MRSVGFGWGSAAVAALLFAATGAQAQWAEVSDACDSRWGDRDNERRCVTMEGTFADPGNLTIDGGLNGGVEVEGWDGNEVSVRAKVWATGPTEAAALDLLDEIELEMRRGELSADGPSMRRGSNWGVTWEVRVPRATDLSIETHNGGIALADVTGRIDFRAQNGGVHLSGLGGEVEGRTMNGGLHIELDGPRWDGRGLDVETTNGGVQLHVPEGYSADLETGTVNGGIDLDFPLRVQGRIGRRLETTLGEGGPLVRATTTNGGVQIVRAGRGVR